MDRLIVIAEILFFNLHHRRSNNRSDHRDCHANSFDMVTPELRSRSILNLNLGFFSRCLRRGIVPMNQRERLSPGSNGNTDRAAAVPEPSSGRTRCRKRIDRMSALVVPVTEEMAHASAGRQHGSQRYQFRKMRRSSRCGTACAAAGPHNLCMGRVYRTSSAEQAGARLSGRKPVGSLEHGM